VPPIFLLVASLTIKATLFAWLRYEDAMLYLPFRLLSKVAIPTSFVQNVLTTGLICSRLVRQHRASRAAGIQPSHSRLSLCHVVRIMIESAIIYPIVLLVSSILWSIYSGSFWVLFGMFAPIIGIVSTLLTIRLHIATTRRQDGTTLFTLSPNPGSSGEALRTVQSGRQMSTVQVASETQSVFDGSMCCPPFLEPIFSSTPHTSK